MSTAPIEPKALLLAPFEIPLSHPLATDHYFPHETGKFGGLQSAFGWELVNLALFHRAAFGEVLSRHGFLQKEAALDERGESKHPVGSDEWEMDQISLSRRRTAFLNSHAEAAAIAGFADELAVIALWSLVEKTLGQTLTIMDPNLHQYRWDQLQRGFSAYGVDLMQLPYANIADECRLVNNAIKHGGVVTPQLDRLARFSGKVGHRIRDLDLAVQTYMIGVYNLVGATLEVCDAQLAGITVRPFRLNPDGA